METAYVCPFEMLVVSLFVFKVPVFFLIFLLRSLFTKGTIDLIYILFHWYMFVNMLAKSD